MNARTELRFSLVDFLAWSETQTARHAFIRGEVVAAIGRRRAPGRVVTPDSRLSEASEGSRRQGLAEAMEEAT